MSTVAALEFTHMSGYATVASITQEQTLLLTRALANESNYHEGVTARVSVLEIRSVTQQVDNGTSYRYEVVAAPVSRVGATTTVDSSHPEVYAIQIYEQSWTNTLQVTGIELLSTDVHTSTITKKHHTVLVPVKHTVLLPVKHVTTTTTTTTTIASHATAATGDESIVKHTGSTESAPAPVTQAKKAHAPTSFLCSIDALFF